MVVCLVIYLHLFIYQTLLSKITYLFIYSVFIYLFVRSPACPSIQNNVYLFVCLYGWLFSYLFTFIYIAGTFIQKAKRLFIYLLSFFLSFFLTY